MEGSSARIARSTASVVHAHFTQRGSGDRVVQLDERDAQVQDADVAMGQSISRGRGGLPRLSGGRRERHLADLNSRAVPRWARRVTHSRRSSNESCREG
jgi:hypothetical protein